MGAFDLKNLNFYLGYNLIVNPCYLEIFYFIRDIFFVRDSLFFTFFRFKAARYRSKWHKGVVNDP